MDERYDKSKNPTEEVQLPKNDIKVLIVEDNKTVCNFLDKILKRNLTPVTIHRAETSNESFHLVSNNTYDLIIVDMTMDIPGDEIISNFRDCNINTPILLTVMSELRISYEYIISIGADAVIYKPIDVALLMDSIEDLLKQDDIHSRGTPSKFNRIPVDFNLDPRKQD